MRLGRGLDHKAGSWPGGVPGRHRSDARSCNSLSPQEGEPAVQWEMLFLTQERKGAWRRGELPGLEPEISKYARSVTERMKPGQSAYLKH